MLAKLNTSLYNSLTDMQFSFFNKDPEMIDKYKDTVQDALTDAKQESRFKRADKTPEDSEA
jgi:hypothetical protein